MQRKLNIGVITRLATDRYYGVVLKGIHQTLKSHNANMFVIDTYMLYRFKRGPGSDSLYYPLASGHIDGWIILTQGASEDYIESVYKTGKPIVLVNCNHESCSCNIIAGDDFSGGEIVTQHLIDHGHKRIAFFGWFDLYDMRERFEGYKHALIKNGIDFDPDLVFRTGECLTQSGIKAANKVIRDGINFTAVFAANDLLAFGIMDAFTKVGIRIPEDIAMVGYDNSMHAKNSLPSLTSMGQNILERGVAAVEKLLKLISGETSSIETITIRSELSIRNSCGCKNIKENEELTEENLDLKKTIIKTLEETLEKSFIIGSDLLTLDINEIKKMLPSMVENYLWKCISFWEENADRNKELFIQRIIDIKSKKDLYTNKYCPIEDFPPKEFLFNENNWDEDDIIWILPVSSASLDLGIISYISPFIKGNGEFGYDSSMVLFNLLGIALDRELASSELKKALETLQQTQEQLIHSEKMVSLGGLVAGVAHEINTPVGVSVTAASFLEEQSSKLKKLFETGKLKRSDMERYMETSTETIRVLLLNLQRASNLISSFKQVAVDQSVEEKRIFRVKEYISEVLLSLKPKLKKTGIVIDVKCPEDLEIYSYPGALSQIITNLVVNSIIHAYDEGQKGNVSIHIYKEESTISFIYSDDGKGIALGYLGKIFDPFFTTKRGSGGTGLGLNIVYNIVSQEYGGSIKCTSELGEGTTFTIKFPVREV